MALDDFLDDEGNPQSSNSTGGGGGGGGGPVEEGEHKTNKLDFSRPYCMVMRYPDGSMEADVSASRNVNPGENHLEDYELVESIRTRLTWQSFRKRCRRQHGVDPLDVAKGNYTFRGYIEELDDIDDEASNPELLAWLIRNTDSHTTPAKKDMCDICGQSGDINRGDMDEIWLTDKDVVSRDQTRVVTCSDHTITEVVAACNNKRETEL